MLVNVTETNQKRAETKIPQTVIGFLNSIADSVGTWSSWIWGKLAPVYTSVLVEESPKRTNCLCGHYPKKILTLWKCYQVWRSTYSSCNPLESWNYSDIRYGWEGVVAWHQERNKKIEVINESTQSKHVFNKSCYNFLPSFPKMNSNPYYLRVLLTRALSFSFCITCYNLGTVL